MKNEVKKDRILNAGEEIISRKGVSETTISEIANHAGVGVSVIYQYFKGKEDLVFSIAGKKMEEILTLLGEHLQGIPNIESRLSKMIWFYLRHTDRHPGYARILLLECLFTQSFYEHPAYQPIYRYSKILMDILRQGVKDGAFRADMNVRTARDIILGMLGCEAFTRSALEEIEACVPDLDAIMSLIHAMIAARPQVEVSKEERVMSAAEKVFSEKGFLKAPVSEIARLAQVAEGTVYEYFQNKEDILLRLSERRLDGYIAELPELFEIRNPIRKLRRFIKYFYIRFFTDRDFLKVFLLEVQLSFRFLGSRAYEKFLKYWQALEAIIEEGKAGGYFRQDVNPRVFRNMFVGTFNNLTLRWFILERDKEIDKVNELSNLTDLLCSAVTFPD